MGDKSYLLAREAVDNRSYLILLPFLVASTTNSLLRLKRKEHMYLSYTFPLLSASSWEMTSPQYSLMNSFLAAKSLVENSDNT